MVMSSLWSDSPEYLHFALAFFIAVDFYFARRNIEFKFLNGLAVWFMGVRPQLREAARVRRITMARANTQRALLKKIRKCVESIWKLTFYSFTEICCLMLIYDKQWFRDKRGWIKGWPNHKLSFSLSVFYMSQCAFYKYSIVSLRFWDTRRKDFPVMMAHHIVVTILIAASYITGFFRIGLVIIGLLGASDILLEATKILRYSNKELAASTFFAFFALSWAVLRLTIFPLWIIRASSYEFLTYVDVSKGYEKMLYYVFNTMLLILLVFHIYWWRFISLMLFKQMRNRGRVGDDVRSDPEDNDD